MLSTRSKHIKRGNRKKTKKHYGGGGGGGSDSKDKYKKRVIKIVELMLLGIITITQANKRIHDELKKHNSKKCCAHFKDKTKTGTVGGLVKALEDWFAMSHSE